MMDAAEDFAAAAADAAEIAADAATDANKLGSRLNGHGRWLDLALLVLLAFVVLICRARPTARSQNRRGS